MTLSPKPPQLENQKTPIGRRYRIPALLIASAIFHGLVVVAMIVRPGWIAYGLLALFLNHAIISLFGLVPKGTALGPNTLRATNSGATDRDLAGESGVRGCIALSFDDGPDPEVTPKVLDLLDEFGAKASFFCIGRRLAEHRELGVEIVRRGHRLENHSFDHSVAFSLSFPRSLDRDLSLAQSVIEEVSGRRARWFRAPAGLRNLWLEPVLARLGLHLVTWTRRSFDTVNRNPRRIADSLTRKLESGDILLLHDGSSARTPAGSAVVLEALPIVLERIRAMGFEGIAIPDPKSEADSARDSHDS